MRVSKRLSFQAHRFDLVGAVRLSVCERLMPCLSRNRAYRLDGPPWPFWPLRPCSCSRFWPDAVQVPGRADRTFWQRPSRRNRVRRVRRRRLRAANRAKRTIRADRKIPAMANRPMRRRKRTAAPHRRRAPPPRKRRIPIGRISQASRAQPRAVPAKTVRIRKAMRVTVPRRRIPKARVRPMLRHRLGSLRRKMKERRKAAMRRNPIRDNREKHRGPDRELHPKANQPLPPKA